MQEFEVIPPSLSVLKKQVKTLYYKGDKTLLDKTIVAIVGSRRPNAYTKRVTSVLAGELAKRDVYVISGGAMGVDALAHKGAYPKTIAVFGNSLDIIYPKINKDLIENITTNALVLSEYPPKTFATKYSFIERNRIVVGLSCAVVIAQADKKSGSMHSANIALEQNKPLYVLPQRMGESDGTNELIALGKAKLIDNIEAFANNFGKIVANNDEILEFCKKNPLLDTCLNRYKEKIYEYELEGKLAIEGAYVRVL